MITRGRVISGGSVTVTSVDVGDGKASTSATLPMGRRIPEATALAHDEARGILERAEQRARTIVCDAEMGASARSQRAEEDGVAKATAGLAARWLAIRAREESAAARDLESSMAVARVLAERSVGAAVESDPKRIVPMAERALREARGARAVVIEAHPLDVGTLRSHVDFFGLPEASLEARVNASLARGDLLFHTDLGTLDARLRPQLERLATALREFR